MLRFEFALEADIPALHVTHLQVRIEVVQAEVKHGQIGYCGDAGNGTAWGASDRGTSRCRARRSQPGRWRRHRSVLREARVGSVDAGVHVHAFTDGGDGVADAQHRCAGVVAR